MKPVTTHIARWLIVALAVLPLISADAAHEKGWAENARLEWLLASHDVRYAIHAPRPTSSQSPCVDGDTEHAR